MIAHRGLSANTEWKILFLLFAELNNSVSKPILWHDDHVCWTNDTKVTRTTYRDLKRIIKTKRLLRPITGEVWEPASVNKRHFNYIKGFHD